MLTSYGKEEILDNPIHCNNIASGGVGRNVKTHVCRFIEVSIGILPFNFFLFSSQPSYF